MRLFEFLDKMNEQDDDNYPRPVDELKKLIAITEQQKDVVESLAREAQKITTEIKYDQTVQDIVSRIRQLAEKITFEDKGYKSEIESAIDDALNAMNELESAVYQIDEPFKDLLRALDNEVLELEYEMDEHKWKRESADPKLTMPKQRDPNWKTMQAKGSSGAAGAHRDKKKEQKQGYEKHKSKGVAEGWDDEDEADKITLIKSLQWPELVNKVNSAMKAMGWKGQRKDDGSFMFSTRGQLDDEWYIVVIDNRGNNMFTYALGTVEEGDPHIGEQESLPMTEASVSELMNAIREGFGLGEAQGVAEGHGRYWCSTDKKWKTRKGPKQTRSN